MKKFICDGCGERFETASQRGSHKLSWYKRQSLASNRNEMYKGCKCTAANQQNLTRNGNGTGPYNCCNCEKIFDRLCALNLHHKSCFGENLGIDLYPFSCEFCDQSYKTFDGLEKHEKRIHQSKTKAGKYVKRDAMKRKPQCKKNQMITDEAAFQAFLSNIERERIVAELELRMQMKKYDIL